MNAARRVSDSTMNNVEFLLGDNTGTAVDSRALGSYNKSSILGRVVGK
jgi:hypothetical protein